MTDDRDRELAERLAELDAPDHRPGFWEAVRAANSTSLASDSGAHFVENETDTNSTPEASDSGAHFVENDEPVRLEERRGTRVAPRLLLAAAVMVLVALVGVGVFVDRQDDRSQGVATEQTGPTVAEDAGDEVDTAPTGPLRPAGDPIERGSGSVVAVDRAGRFLYVADDAPDGGFGCEGAPRRALFVEPINGGERKQVLPVDMADATSGINVRFGPEGEIAVHSQCEGYGATVVTGTVGDDGTITDPTELTLSDAEGILDLEFRAAGLLVASTYLGVEGTDRRHLYEFPVRASEPTDLGPTDVVHLDVTTDGRLATSSVDGTIRFDGEEVAQVDEPRELAVSDSGQQLVVETGWRPGGILLIDTTSGEQTRLEEPAQFDSGTVVFPAKGVIVYSYGESASQRVYSVTFDGEREEPTFLVQAQGWTEIVVTTDLTRLFVTGYASEGEASALNPVVLEQRLTR